MLFVRFRGVLGDSSSLTKRNTSRFLKYSTLIEALIVETVFFLPDLSNLLNFKHKENLCC